MKNINWNNVSEASDARLTAGGYVCGIVRAEDVPEKEYLRIEFDIAEGPYKNYFRDLRDRLNLDKWPSGGVLIRSYKEKAQPFFKSFLTSVQNSNPGYVFQNDEATLSRKLIGMVLGEEEYEYNGEIKTRLRVSSTHSVKAIRDKDFTVPEKKYLPSAATSYTAAHEPIDDTSGDLPF